MKAQTQENFICSGDQVSCNFCIILFALTKFYAIPGFTLVDLASIDSQPLIIFTASYIKGAARSKP
jgi:hypothetical protein